MGGNGNKSNKNPIKSKKRKVSMITSPAHPDSLADSPGNAANQSASLEAGDKSRNDLCISGCRLTTRDNRGTIR